MGGLGVEGGEFLSLWPTRGMPRRPRYEAAGAIHHVWARGNARQLIFYDDEDRAAFVRLLEEVCKRMGWKLLSYVLMDNHIHLLVETPEPNLGRGMQRLLGTYARRFNLRHDRVGHVFHRPYGSAPKTDDAMIQATACYIAMNPVAAQMCEAPEDHLWGSHALMSRGKVPGWLDEQRLLSFFAPLGGQPRARYDAVVAAGSLLNALKALPPPWERRRARADPAAPQLS